MSLPQNFPASAAAGMSDIESNPINSDQASLKRIPGLHFVVGTNGRIMARPGTPQLKLLTQAYCNENPIRDASKLIAHRGVDILEAYFKVIATAANGSNALVAANNHLAWVPALRILTREKRWNEYPGVTNQQVQSVMDAFGDARKRFVDGHLASDPACKAQPNREPFKSFVDLLDRFNVARGIQTAPTATVAQAGHGTIAAASAAPVAPAQSALTVPSAFQTSANHLQSTADKMIRDAFSALQISDQQNDQISNNLQTSAAQLQAATTKTIQDAIDAFNVKDKAIETITQQNDQANKAAQMAQAEITALRAKYEKLMEKNAEATATAVVASLTDTITGAVTHAMAEIEAAEQRGSISGQEMLFTHIVDDLNELEALRGGEDVEWGADELEEYKEKHHIPDF
ncbi:hypothetical protein CFIO01_07381 [Colletotrichum fioriniae PJ7]|uniref:Uncharacterized protein n=1 Tax=Colletotrichum fioriniae PJ7 TaxID=1445577 RepID=A0A010RNP1_9PEZI|nr:hypothetical protein CFIO01_07381 [Colletotrichum fioriniae PJ7]